MSLQIRLDTENTTHSYLELLLEEAVILEEQGIIQTRQGITMGVISEIVIEESDSEPQLINGGAFGKEVEVIKKKNLWSRFKILFTKD